jgi:hypothetical protein
MTSELMRKDRSGRGAMLALAAGVFAAISLAPTGADAYDRRGYRADGYGKARYVVAESRWGRGTVRGEVRPGRHGWQVRLPGGTWIDCVRSCSETLRLQTVDFWETVGPNPKDGGPGYLHFEFNFR